jgi:uracil-DNA glycosylase
MGVGAAGAEPGRDCPLCPRLVAFRETWRAKESAWHNAPVPSFGPASARLAVVGLAPGLRGANRTGRPFTGDFAGDLLYATLAACGFSCGTFQARADDGLQLVDCRIINAVRCVPPENKPTPAEIRTCRQFLEASLAEMPTLKVVVALGRIAHDSVLTALGVRASQAKFAHGAVHVAGRVTVLDSYHCSRLNTNTGVLTPTMFRAVFDEARRLLDAA